MKKTLEDIKNLYQTPLLKLIGMAHTSLTKSHNPLEVELAHLISVKTGGCQEDCKYCAQSSRYTTPVAPSPLLSVDEVLSRAIQAKKRGASRICLGGAWRALPRGKTFNAVLDMVKQIANLDLEVCCTMGTVTKWQLEALKKEGLYAYNHNLDSSETFYKTIITTRSYQERLQTLDRVANSQISVCCGGILGMGESADDRITLLHTLCSLPTAPQSIPINILWPVKGTPLEKQPPIEIWEVIRTIATARVLFPEADVRLSAGREKLHFEAQALCFLAGVNSIFIGDQLLTVKNQSPEDDETMLELFGLQPRKSHACPS